MTTSGDPRATSGDPRVDEMYRAARTEAMAEFDALIIEVNQLNVRIRSLRFAILGLGNLIGEHTDEPYEFPRKLV